MSLRAVDVRFALPGTVERAAVLGDRPDWVEGLRRGGVVVAADVQGVDAVFATAENAHAAFASSAPAALVVGGGRQRGGAHIASLPDAASPELLLPYGQAAATRHAVGRWRTGESRVRSLRNRLAAHAIARHVPLPGRPGIHVVAARPGPPLAVALAADAAGIHDPQWYGRFGVFANAHSRGTFFVFDADADEPALVVKFSRVPGLERLFDLDDAGLRLAESFGGKVAAVAPRLIGRFDLGGGLVASAESAGRGDTLGTILRSGASRGVRLAQIDMVAAWLVEVARETRGQSRWLTDELALVAAESLASDERAALGSLDAVFAHGDVHGENLLVDGSSFTLVDWESATASGPPLWDLLYFLTGALALLDGVDSEDAREAHFVALCRGESPSSAALFRWLRSAQEASQLPDEAVGPLATLLWSHLAALEVEHLRRVREADSRGTEAEPMQRRARRWREEPGLGSSWPARS